MIKFITPETLNLKYYLCLLEAHYPENSVAFTWEIYMPACNHFLDCERPRSKDKYDRVIAFNLFPELHLVVTGYIRNRK